jgi:DNA-binding IclR family transcriptional regulator
VLNALAEAQDARGGEGVYAGDIARRAGLPRDRVSALLHDLSAEHRLVTQLHGSDSPDVGPRFEVKPRL